MRSLPVFRLSGIVSIFMLVHVISAAPILMDTTVLIDKIKGGWLGKTAGVCIGAPTEFVAQGGTMFKGSLNFTPDMAGGFNQDDIYVQMTFLSVMDAKLAQPSGVFAANMLDYGNAFKNTTYGLWWANAAGRDNLKRGINPPLSGMWGGAGHQYNNVCEAIDFQIECDWIGMMCPAMPQTAQRLCDSVGHVMNYADGLYGGYFVTAMIALAFQNSDPHQIVRQALKTLPPRSGYYQIINDVVNYHDANPTKGYDSCWYYIMRKYLSIKQSPCFTGAYNILASYNGSFIAIGLMYCDGDINKAIEYSCRCGQDSDCNPANAGAIMGVMLGYKALPQAWRTSAEAMSATRTYPSSSYTYSKLISTSIARAKKCIEQTGGTLNDSIYTINAEAPQQPRMLEIYGADPAVNPDYQMTSARRASQIATEGVPLRSGVSTIFDVTGKRVSSRTPHQALVVTNAANGTVKVTLGMNSVKKLSTER